MHNSTIIPDCKQTKVIQIVEKAGLVIFNLGHGIFKETPIENVEVVLKEVDKFNAGK